MRIQGPFGTATAASPTVNRPKASATFTVSTGADARPAAAPAGLRSVSGIDALIALQGVEGPLERRKRAVRRGQVALDALDELKVGLLSGDLTPVALTRLKSAAGSLKDGSGDSGLDLVLAEIELRVEVEIAKLSSR